jgi:hypothetical protein
VSVEKLRPAAYFVAALFALFSAGAAAQTSSLNPDAIFAKARAVWDAQAYPARIDYIVIVRVVKNGAPATEHFAGEYAPASSDLHVIAVSDEQLANPEVPHGVDLRITRRWAGKTVMSVPVTSDSPDDYLGVPLLQPMYSFGLAGAQGGEPEEEPVDGTAGPQVIGTVIARTRTYAIANLGEEAYGAGRAYHLALRPLRDPGRYRLRELWVDTGNFATLKAITEGNFVTGPGTRVNWTITFKTIDGAQYIDTETADAPLRAGPHDQFDAASIAFESIEPRHGMPPMQFMFAQLPVHNALTEPNL